MNLRMISQEWLKIEVKLPVSANRKSYAALIGTTMDDFEWLFHALHAVSAVAELFVCQSETVRRAV